jgi:hypothetical protein
MPGCYTSVSQHGAEEGGMDCGGRGGHQTPGPNMEGMDGGGAGWGVAGWPDWATGGGISMGVGADVLLDFRLISPKWWLLGMAARVWERWRLGKIWGLNPWIWRARNRFGARGIDLAGGAWSIWRWGRGSGARDQEGERREDEAPTSRSHQAGRRRFFLVRYATAGRREWRSLRDLSPPWLFLWWRGLLSVGLQPIISPCLDHLKIPSFFTLSPSHQFLAACMEY